MARTIFTALDGNGTAVAWVTDGTAAGTTILVNPQTGAGYTPPGGGYIPLGPGRVAVVAQQANLTGFNLVSTDGTPAGTVALAQIGPSSVQQSAQLDGGRAAFLAYSLPTSLGANYGLSLWVTNGTTAGTSQVAAVFNGFQTRGPVMASLGDGRVLFIAPDTRFANLFNLWVSDGTASGTTVLSQFSAGAVSSLQLVPIGGGQALFTASDASGSLQPWVTDGTAAGTKMLADTAGGATFPFDAISNITPLGNGRTVFLANSKAYITDGTPRGTTAISGIQLGSGANAGLSLRTIGGGRLVYSGANSDFRKYDGNQPWVTDGTTAGTYELKSVSAGVLGSDPTSFTPIGAGRFLFLADDGVHGRELWLSDGTRSGTVLLKDVSPGPGSSVIAGLTHVGNGQVLFELANGASGPELWTTDGTAAGTIEVRSVPFQQGFGAGPIPPGFTPLSPVTLPYTPETTRVVSGTVADGSVATLFLGESGVPDVVQSSSGRRGVQFAAGTGDDVQVTRGARVDLLRHVEAMQFIDGRQVFDPNDPAAAVARLYQSGLGRAPDQAGLNYWIAQLGAGASLADVAGSFLAAPEFTSRFGAGLGNADFVTAIYQNVLGRAPDAGGLGYWAGVLDSGVNSRSTVLASISESAENRAGTAALTSAGIWDASEAAQQVARLYDVALGRLPDAAGLHYWTSEVEGGVNSLLAVAATFVTSAEFTATYGALASGAFVGKVYENTLGRAADADGLAFWTAQLDAGASRAAVALGFSESAEHQARTAAITGGDSPATFGIKLA